jgi:hypothetical protein
MSPLLVEPPLLAEATPLDGYRVRLRFTDGLAADVDLSHLVGAGPVFEPLRNLDYFRRLYDHVQRAVYEQRGAAAASN